MQIKISQTLTRLTPFFTLIEKNFKTDIRVFGQVIIAPLVTAALYIFVFGFVLGSTVKEIDGLSYIAFVFPGVFALNLIISVFSAGSSGIYFMKFQKTLEDFLTLPISYFELVLSLIIRGIIRGLLLAVSIGLVAFIFGVNSIVHPFIFLFYVVLISSLFGLLGIISGIWADNSFERLNVMMSFVLTPLTFLGGVFYTASMLPASMQFIIHFNPVFYAVDGLRYSLTGHSSASISLGLLVLFALATIFTIGVVYIFKTGWKLRS
jgi:ABC-2 type transport system permease protein